ncbi:MAG TPA: M14 metallopeptidase family protein [Vicinamibacterales bacterium]|nr:M14 metallopeptidase family protein [Vicinamibacterales bacterium]
MRPRPRFLLLPALLAIAVTAAAQTRVTSPKQFFGFNIGDDYQLATYTQLTEYWKKLDAESDRLRVVEIGRTAEDRPQLMAIISAPANFRKLDRYQEISRRLAKAEGLTDEQAHALAHEGKAVVWIDGGLHSTEVLGPHQLIETVYQLVSRTDPETMRILDDCIVLAAIANPDGMELVSSWYMRNPDPKQRSTGNLPRLYHKYVGHDDNRDFYMSTQPETTNINRILYREWFPQIVYDHHQTGPAGTVMFAPPFRDPFNYVFDPIVPAELDLIGAAMATRFNLEGKPGVTSRQGSSYSTWWNGGLRTTPYFHNMIGLLTETIGNPTPIQIPFVPDKQLPDGSLEFPIAPQTTWHFRQSIDYSITANWAVLDTASRHREQFLFNIYQMGKNAIERGSRDHWTMYPGRIEALKARIRKERSTDEVEAQGRRGGRGVEQAPARYFEELRKPEWRDPRGYIIPSDQADFLTATKFVNALIKLGITVDRATQPFTVNGKSYPAGSYVVKCAQAFRPHILDMFEPQDYPDDIPYPGGPPTPPYDSTGWTLAYQMGVQFDRILDGFDGPFEAVNDLQKPSAGTVAEAGAAGYTFSHATNDAFEAVNRLIAGGEEVFWDQAGSGAFYVAAKGTTAATLRKIAADTGVSFAAAASRPGTAVRLRTPRIALVDRYGGSMPSGWTRWTLEQFDFPFDVVFPRTLDAGNLRAKYDAIIFVDDTGPRSGRGFGGGQPDAASIPAEYRDRLGAVTVEKTVPQIRTFLEQGGTVLSIGGSTSLAYELGLPISDHLVEKSPTGESTPLPRSKYYVPGSVLRASVDTSNPLAQGITNPVDVFFDNSPVFQLGPDAAQRGVTAVAWFDSPTPLRSGWAWGEGYLDGGAAIVEARVGKGRLFLFGPEILFRAQPHGTFGFLFNGLYLAGQTGDLTPSSQGISRQGAKQPRDLTPRS